MSGRRDPGISRVPSTSRQPDLHAIFPHDASRSLRRSPAGALIFSTVRLRPEPGNAALAHLLDSNALRTDQVHRVDVVGLEVAVCRRETPIPGSTGHELRGNPLQLLPRGRASTHSAVVLTPVTTDTPAVLEGAQRENPGIGDAPLRPAPKDPSPCVSRWLSRDWWETAEAPAGLESKRGRGWYFLRRKFAPH